MSTHNIYFHAEIRKLLVLSDEKHALTGATFIREKSKLRSRSPKSNQL